MFVSQGVLEDVYRHLNTDLRREQGGVLVGLPYRDTATERMFVDVTRAIPALGAEGTSVHLQLTPEAWSHISGTISEAYRGLIIVGWYHSHPGLGAFFSSTDRASQRSFFNQPWSVGWVVDPIRREELWFSGPTCEPLSSILTYGVDRRRRSVPPVQPGQRYRALVAFGLLGLAAGLGIWILLRERNERG